MAAALTEERFYNILTALVELRITRAKSRMQELHEDISFEVTPDFRASFEIYWNHVLAVYQPGNPENLPRIYRSAALINLGIPEAVSIDCWLAHRCIALQLLPLDIHAVMNQLNDDFGTHYTFATVDIHAEQELRITYMLKDTPALIAHGLFIRMEQPGHSECYILEPVNKNAPLF